FLSFVDVYASLIPSDPPLNISFPYGFYNFTLPNVGIGGKATITMYLNGGPLIDTYYCFGLTPTSSYLDWYEFMYDSLTDTGVTINGDTITISLVDGGRGDSDGMADGVITYQGGGGIEAAPGETPPPVDTSPSAFGGGGCSVIGVEQSIMDGLLAFGLLIMAVIGFRVRKIIREKK
nr:hypothetical protein [Candidatus Aenigmarchaeota archaeon]